MQLGNMYRLTLSLEAVWPIIQVYGDDTMQYER